MSESSSAAPQRFHALDALRAGAMLLGVYLHGALPYIRMDIPWPVREPLPHPGLDLTVGLIHAFRMQLFFLLAGFFGRLVYQRYGPAGYLRHRVKRIGIPFVAGMALMLPFIHWAFAAPFRGLPTGHLWFLEYLLIFYGAAWLMFRSLGRGRIPLAIRERWAGLGMRLLESRWKPLPLAVPAACLLAFSPLIGEIEPLPGWSIVPTWPGLLYYGFFFGLGWFGHRDTGWLERTAGQVVPHVLLGCAFVVVSGAFQLKMMQGAEVGTPAGVVAILLTDALGTWCLVFASLGMCQRLAWARHPMVRYVADSAYWIYLAHLPLLLWLQDLVQDWPGGPLVHLGLVLGIGLAVLGASYHWLVRYTWIGTLLNGPRKRGVDRA